MVTQYGKTLISGGAEYLTNAVGEHYGLSKEARFALVMGAGMLTGFGLEGIDKHFNISGYHLKPITRPANENTSWYKEDGSLNYPPNNGAVSGTEAKTTLQKGQVIGRYGNASNTSDYLAPPGASTDSLSLPPNLDSSQYSEYIVLKPIPEAIQSTVTPWGSSTGLGIQYQVPKPILWLVDNGYLMPI